ncbi:trypsin-1 isoform X1 [Daphnia magna]|uniref:trypsin-1 isoform X1 n=1 Tax=Daphnia magna TaxID=35525 RepID=UPI001E1B9F79|nr:trypsin-1 isoform X1 [Daphnia magna]
MRNILIFSLLVAFATGAPQDISDRIAGGSLAVEGEFPYIASIQLERRHFCSGFIYNERWILTTASCVYGLLPTQLDVAVGIISFSEPSAQQQIIAVSSISINDQYDPLTKMNDIALLSLSRPVVFGTAVQTIRYDEVDETINTAVTMGWGATTEGGLETLKLRKTELTMPADCLSYGSIEFDNNYMICAGSDVSSPCQYDEGSPLVQNGIAVGVMSKNQGCGVPYVPSIFTRLSVYYYWLNVIAGQQPLPTATTTTKPTTTTTIVVPTAPCINCETPPPTTTTIVIPTAPCLNCETPPPTTTTIVIPTAPCLNCETPPPTTTTIVIPTAPCLNCETPPPTTTTTVIPTAPCLNCETPPTTTVAPIVPTAPCLNCEPAPETTTVLVVPTAPCIGCDA